VRSISMSLWSSLASFITCSRRVPVAPHCAFVAEPTHVSPTARDENSLAPTAVTNLHSDAETRLCSSTTVGRRLTQSR
jgi:hypothetical protein